MKKLLAILCLLTLSAEAAIADRLAVATAIRSLRDAASGAATVVTSPVTGSVTFFAVESGRGIATGAEDSAGDEERALRFLGQHGAAFGFASPDELRVQRTSRDALGQVHVRLQQTHLGVPVAGGELLVHLREGRVVAANGTSSAGLEGLDVTPLRDATAALDKAEESVAARFGAHDLRFSEPRLEILDRGLLEGRSTPARLAWFIEAKRLDLREYLWVDAQSGQIILQFSQLTDALNRFIYDMTGLPILPGVLVRSEGDPATGDLDVDNAYQFSGDTYNYYLASHGRDSYDNAGAALISSTHLCNQAPCSFDNAAWDGAQMLFGNGFAGADDVVGHELTHAVTANEARLFYYVQSGALNESYSDIFGESVDLGNGLGDDTPEVRWEMGEDLPIGALRDMADPGAFGQPGRVLDPNFYCGDGDGGGVHVNSGVPNKAYTLMVDGGSFNGHTIVAIGRPKADKVQYRALTTYLLSASGFLDNYNALNLSCQDLIGTAGITVADCAQVQEALDAVEMTAAVPCLPTPPAAPDFCPADEVLSEIDFETSAGFSPCANQTPLNFCVNGLDSWFGPFATSGVKSLRGANRTTVADINGAIVFPGALPTGAKLQFNHSFGFEGNVSTAYDGGVIEYSVDGGGVWTDAASLISAGPAYTGTIANCCGNPLANRPAFVRESGGYTTSRLNLASLAGQSLRFRFRVGTDSTAGDPNVDLGWFIDDVRLYTCSLFSDGFNSGNMGAWSSIFP